MKKNITKTALVAIFFAFLVLATQNINQALAAVEVHREVQKDIHRVGPRGKVLDKHVKREFDRHGREVDRSLHKDVHRLGVRGGSLDKHVDIEVQRQPGFFKRIVHRDILRVFPNGRKVERHIDKVKVRKIKSAKSHGY